MSADSLLGLPLDVAADGFVLLAIWASVAAHVVVTFILLRAYKRSERKEEEAERKRSEVLALERHMLGWYTQRPATQREVPRA